MHIDEDDAHSKVSTDIRIPVQRHGVKELQMLLGIHITDDYTLYNFFFITNLPSGNPVGKRQIKDALKSGKSLFSIWLFRTAS